ncbi:glycosyltransferase, partial [bacterium]
MKISIITVVYNNERTIEDAINSVLAQDYADIEYVIIDGNSSDGTTSIIKKYQDQIEIFISESDKGLYDAMNKGVLASTGDVIGILNSDDLYQDKFVISDIAEQFKSNPVCDIIYGDLVYVDKDNVDKIVRKWKSKPYYPKFFEHGYVPPHPALFLKREVYEKAGLFDLNFRLAA